MLTTFLIPRNARVLQEGDSLTGEDTASLGYMATNLLRIRVMSAYTRAVPISSSRDRPIWRNAATNGATSAIISARIAAEVTASNPTHFILADGVNDASGAVARATTLANHTAILAALPATCQILVFDPLCFGEKWPTGQNTTPSIDQAIDFISTDLLALLQSTYANRAAFISWRHNIYDAIEPQLNTPGPGSTVGPLTRPDANGQHPNALGVSYIDKQVMTVVSLAA